MLLLAWGEGLPARLRPKAVTDQEPELAEPDAPSMRDQGAWTLVHTAICFLDQHDLWYGAPSDETKIPQAEGISGLTPIPADWKGRQRASTLHNALSLFLLMVAHFFVEGTEHVDRCLCTIYDFAWTIPSPNVIVTADEIEQARSFWYSGPTVPQMPKCACALR